MKDVYRHALAILQRRLRFFLTLGFVAYIAAGLPNLADQFVPQDLDSSVAKVVGFLISALSIAIESAVSAIAMVGAFFPLKSDEFSTQKVFAVLRERFTTIVIVSIKLSAIIIVGFFLFIIPGVVFFANYVFAMPSAIVVRGAQVDHLKRSKELVYGVRVLMLAHVLLISIVVVGIPWLVKQWASPAVAEQANLIGGALQNIVTSVFLVVAYQWRLRSVGEPVLDILPPKYDD